MTSGSKQVIVGQFFERVCQQILGGELRRNKDGDICLYDLMTTIEVKSSGTQSSYGFRLDLGQIASYEQLIGFPFNTALYALFSYSNRSVKVGARRCTQLSQYEAAEDIDAFLTIAAERCVIVDLSIVRQWNALLPKSCKSILGHLGTETVDIRCRLLESYVNGQLGDQLRYLELEPSEYRILSGKIDIEGLSFPITFILPKPTASVIRKLLKQRGIILTMKQPA